MKNSKIQTEVSDVDFDTFDDLNHPREESSDFSQIVDEALARRQFMKLSLNVGLGSFLAGCSSLSSVNSTSHKNADAMASSVQGQSSVNAVSTFSQVKASTADTVIVPEEFDWDVVVKWGDPLWSDGQELDEENRGTSATQKLAFGDNNDGMALFKFDDTYLLVVNNEYTNRSIIYGNRKTKLPENEDDVLKGMYAHGVSIMEVKQTTAGRWYVVKDSQYNRRITAQTPMEIVGPLRGYDKLKTKDDPEGIRSLGTWNNCANGRTPWGTYLACEENFNGYFSSSDEQFEPSKAMKRYGVGNKDWGYGWAKYDERFDISKAPNEPNRAGYVVEINPTDPLSIPRKLTALGRMKHENAEVVIAKDGRVVVYMGDDERGEYLYRFISHGKYVKSTPKINDLLHRGTLYAAKFYTSGRGEWLALTPETTGMTREEICLHTRMAASAVRATTMDRPEWVSASPVSLQVVCALTNNKNRGIKPNKGGDATPVGGPNPREKNLYGQIVRWFPNEDHTAHDFTWDLFAMAGNPEVHADEKAGSANISPENMFNSPDGLAFDRQGNLWILTDGKYSNKGDFKGMGNNQMLVGNLSTKEIKRFLVGPKEAEVTGITWSPDYKTAFVGIQHPGEKGDSHFPLGGNHVPRSAIVSVWRKDGQPIVA